MELVQTKGGFSLSRSDSQTESGHSQAVFPPSAECLEPSPSTQTLLCFQSLIKPHNPLVTPQQNNQNLGFVNQQLKPCLCLWLSKDQSHKVVLGFVLLP